MEMPEISRAATLQDEEADIRSKEEASSDATPFLVGWDSDTDPENPRNWSSGYKVWITLQLGMTALAASMGSSIVSPAANQLSEYLHVSTEVVVLNVSLYM